MFNTWEIREMGSLSQNLFKRLINFSLFGNISSPKPLNQDAQFVFKHSKFNIHHIASLCILL